MKLSSFLFATFFDIFQLNVRFQVGTSKVNGLRNRSVVDDAVEELATHRAVGSGQGVLYKLEDWLNMFE